MNLLDRFQRLTTWNKVGVVGALASIIALPLALSSVLADDNSLSVEGGDSSNNILTTGNNNEINVGTSQAETDAAMILVLIEIEENLFAADLHIGLCSTLIETDIWPAEVLVGTLESIRAGIAREPLRQDAYLAAQTKEEIVTSPNWQSVRSFPPIGSNRY